MFNFWDYIKEQAAKNGMSGDAFDTLAENYQLPDLDTLSQSLQAHTARMAMTLDMSAEELLALSDDELYEAVFNRITEKDELNEIQHAFNVAAEYIMEMENGGLCQYFVNFASRNAAELPEVLERLGAAEHKVHFEHFVKDNGIDLNDLSAFTLDYDGDWAEAYAEKCAMYPFDAYDDAFYALSDLHESLLSFIRSNIEQF